MEKAGVTPDVVSFNTVLDAYAKNNEPEKAEALLQRMEKAGVHRDPHYQDDHEICVATCRGEVAIKTGTGSPAAAFRGVGGPRNRRRGTGRVGEKETPATGQPRGSVPPPSARRDRWVRRTTTDKHS